MLSFNVLLEICPLDMFSFHALLKICPPDILSINVLLKICPPDMVIIISVFLCCCPSHEVCLALLISAIFIVAIWTDFAIIFSHAQVLKLTHSYVQKHSTSLVCDMDVQYLCGVQHGGTVPLWCAIWRYSDSVMFAA